MGYLYTGENGTPLKDILAQYDNQDFDVIECRCKWEENGEMYDELFGYCQYINGELKPLDGDTYSLEDKYVEWEAWVNDKIVDDKPTLLDTEDWLTVWEYGRLSDKWE